MPPSSAVIRAAAGSVVRCVWTGGDHPHVTLFALCGRLSPAWCMWSRVQLPGLAGFSCQGLAGFNRRAWKGSTAGPGRVQQWLLGPCLWLVCVWLTIYNKCHIFEPIQPALPLSSWCVTCHSMLLAPSGAPCATLPPGCCISPFDACDVVCCGAHPWASRAVVACCTLDQPAGCGEARQPAG